MCIFIDVIFTEIKFSLFKKIVYFCPHNPYPIWNTHQPDEKTMRKTLFLLAPVILFLTACSDGMKTYKIGMSQCAGGQWRDMVNQEMLAAQHLYEQNAQVTIVNAHDDTQQQIRQIDSLADAGIDLLVVAPNESGPIAEAIVRTRKKGIPVIFFDRKAETQDYTAFIGGNNVEAGEIVAYGAVDLAQQMNGGRPSVLEITGSLSTSPARERHEGFAKVMAGHGEVDYEWVKSDWTSEQAYEVVRQRLAGAQRPDIIFCHNDGMTTGAYKALKEAGKETRVRLLGIDGMPDEGLSYVQQGLLAGTYIYPTHGEEVVRLALNILTGQPYDHDNYMQGVMVTPDNVGMIAHNSRELMKQNQHLITIHDKLENAFGLYNAQKKMLLASLVSIALLIVGLFLIWRAVRQTRRANARMKALNEEQTLFYTNASHQLKTPLTLIAGPVRQLLNTDTLKADQRELLEIVGRNVDQLETVTSSVLNFRKEIDATAVADATASDALQNLSKEIIQENRVEMLKQDDSDELANILIVDDNEDMRRYLRTLLADKFFVLEAPDGQSGLKLARESVPDLIVSDVMMPVMDGLQFCKQLKEDLITSHIPVILLTARSEEAQQMEGYESGADAYLTKPFKVGLLIARINNLLRSRKQLRHLFDGRQEEERVQLATQDKLFIDQLKEAIRKHMQNPNLKMDELGDEIGLSRVQMYRKVKVLTGYSPVELLRQMRLQRAYTLLGSTTKTVAEVAYEVGFNTPGYFSKCFREQYGKQPSDLRAE